MKLTMKSVALCLAWAALPGVPAAFADGPSLQNVEVLVGNVFVPKSGYEDKNTIEVTVDGYLPNSCYQLGDTTIERASSASTFVVHQYADLRTDGVCHDPDNPPPSMRDMVPYFRNVTLGHLSAGNYRILFNIGTAPERASYFNVAVAKTLTIDDFPYAAVSSVYMPDIVNGAHAVTATLVGSLANSCQYLKEVRILPEPETRVMVVLPILGFKTGQMCAQLVMPFEYQVNLGKLGEGRYLLHVRSQNGQAVTRVFGVIRPDPS